MPTFTRGYLGSLEIQKAYLGSNLVFSSEPTYLQFTTTGSSFSPFVELHPGSTTTVEWLDENGDILTTGLTPTINFGSAATRVVTMSVQDPEEVRIVNLGFNAADDNGRDSLSASYNKAAEQVIAVDGIQYLSGLIGFMAANGPLAGHLDLSGCESIEYVECFAANVESVDLTGCSSLIRLCFEGTDLTELDLNPVRATLRDLRAANVQGGSLTLAPLVGPMESLWHFCCRSQLLYGLPSWQNLPVIEQLWIWNAGLSGSIKAYSNVMMDSVLLTVGGSIRPDLENKFTSVDVSGNSWAGGSRLYMDSMGTLDALNLSNTNPVAFPRTMRLNDNSLDSPTLDALLALINGWGSSGGTLNLEGNQQPPSVSVGQGHITALTSRGWTVTSATPVEPVEAYWTDTFERANGAVGSPWVAPTGGGTANIVDGKLFVTGGTSYQRCWAMPSGIPTDDYEVVITFDGTPTAMPYFGVLFRMDATGAGAKVLFADPGTVPRTGTSTSATGTNADVVGSGPPTSWSQPGTHTLAVRLLDSNAQIYCDGVLSYSRNASNMVGPGLGVGICGQLHTYSINSILVKPL